MTFWVIGVQIWTRELTLLYGQPTRTLHLRAAQLWLALDRLQGRDDAHDDVCSYTVSYIYLRPDRLERCLSEGKVTHGYPYRELEGGGSSYIEFDSVRLRFEVTGAIQVPGPEG